MNIEKFQRAEPALPSSNKVSPIKLSVTKDYGRNSALPPLLTFYISTKWITENWGMTENISAQFLYDNSISPPVGLLEFGGEGARLASAGAYSLKVNFHAWPNLNGDAYKSRTECPIIEIAGSRAYFHMPPSKTKFDVNAGRWITMPETHE